MIPNFFRIAWRQATRQKAISAINIGGLALGIASSIVLLSYVSFQRSYDGFTKDKQDIYRVNLDIYQDNRLAIHSAENYSATGPALKADFPGVLEQVRFYNLGYKNNCIFSYDSLNFKETKWLYADAGAPEMFSIPFLLGDPHTALTQPYSAIISASTAQKIFGNDGVQKAIGKAIRMTDDDRNNELCTITGVFKDIPDNSHLKYNILLSWATLDNRGYNKLSYPRFETNWDRKDFYTYIRLRPGLDPNTIAARLPDFIHRRIPGEAANHRESRMYLQPLTAIHFTPGWQDEPEPTVNGKAIGFLSLIAFFIIVIAWVNYINLATANSVHRAREIGIRKVLGSTRGKLIRQFLIESVALNALSAGLAAIAIYAARPLLHSFFAVPLPLEFLFTTGYGWLFLGFLLMGTLLSGLYPALVLSAFKPVLVLKGKGLSSMKGISLRRILVVFQFTLSILLIIGTIVVYQQVHFMLHQDIGINTSQLMVLDRPGRWDTARSTHNSLVQRFRDAVQRDPGVASIAMSDEKPGKEIRWPSIYVNTAIPRPASVPISTTTIDDQYIPSLGFHLLAGRNFSRQYKTDGQAVILSASAVSALGFTRPADAAGKSIKVDGGTYTILGVVNDFHQLSLQNQGAPSAFQYEGGDLREFEYYYIRLNTAGLGQTVDHIRAAWTSSFRDNPFEYSFLDESFNSQYKSEIQFGLIFGAFSLLAICIACIGLLGLVAFMVRQRTKEIGVRKVLGAATKDILLLLTTDFVRLILLANAIAWPLGWWLMTDWLKDFAYRIHIHWLIFLAAGSIAIVIALATILAQAVKAALTNPIDSLRSE